MRAGAPRPDVSSADAFRRTLLAAKSVAYSTGPSGNYLAGLFERMGIAAEIRDVKPPEPYKGKGVRYTGEAIVLKETKKK